MKIRLWKLGSLEHKLLPKEETIQRLADLLFDPNSEVKDIIWGPDIEVREINTGKMNCLEGFAYWLKGYLSEGCDIDVIQSELNKRLAEYELNETGGVAPQSSDVVPTLLEPGYFFTPGQVDLDTLEKLRKINETPINLHHINGTG